MSTPRTDSMVSQISGWDEYARARNLAFLSRQLERELNEAKAELARLKSAAMKVTTESTLKFVAGYEAGRKG